MYTITEIGRSKAPTKAGRSKAPTRAGRSKAPTRASLENNPSSGDSDNLRFLESDEDQEIYEELCLEKNYFYYFFIADSFGDGICCSQGQGSFLVEVNGHVLEKGGNFGDLLKVAFRFSSCVSNDECDDSNFCTEDECNSDLSLCLFHTKACDECGAVVTITIRTDEFPDETSWTVQEENKIMFNGGPYEVSFVSYDQNTCLPKGMYLFTIYDQYEDGFQCDDYPQCGYSISVNDQLVSDVYLEHAGDIFDSWSRLEESFGVCINDSDCIDSNSCTLGICMNNFCQFFDDPICSTCNRSLVSIHLTTDNSPKDTSWEIRNIFTNQIMSQSTPYGIKNTLFEHKKCLPKGEYKFTIFHNEYGLCSSRYMCGEYILIVEDNVEGQGADFKYNESVYFQLPSSTETLAPTKKPLYSTSPTVSQLLSSQPSISPRMYNRTESKKSKFVENWFISLMEIPFNETFDQDIVVLQYNLSSGKSVDQFVSIIYDETCSHPDESNTFAIINRTIIPLEESHYAKGLIYIEPNKSKIQNSAFSKRNSKNSVRLNFCVRTELFYKEASVSFVETIVALSYNLLASTFRIIPVSLAKEESLKIGHEYYYEVTACICHEYITKEIQCILNPIFHQNSKFNICVKSNKDMLIKKFVNTFLYQDNVLKFMAVKQGMPNELVSLKNGHVGIIETRIISTFFLDPVPLPVIMRGTVLLEFQESHRLLTFQNGRDVSGIDQIRTLK